MISIRTKQISLQNQDLVLLGPKTRLQQSCVSLQSLTPLPRIPVGACLGPEPDQAFLQALSGFWDPLSGQRCYWLQARQGIAFTPGLMDWLFWKNGYSLAWVTLSDKGHQGQRQDSSGPLIPQLVQKVLSLDLVQGFLLPDESIQLKGLLNNLCLEQNFDLVFTTGGTGLTPRDITPEVTLGVLDKTLPGFEQVMLQASLAHTPHGMISRAVAGILDQTLIVNLPGSPQAVQENLASILPALQHAMEKMHGQETECAR